MFLHTEASFRLGDLRSYLQRLAFPPTVVNRAGCSLFRRLQMSVACLGGLNSYIMRPVVRDVACLDCLLSYLQRPVRWSVVCLGGMCFYMYLQRPVG